MNVAEISVIVPVLNEAATVQTFLRRLRATVGDAEIIVVDGGSSDETTTLAAGLCDQLLCSQRGRSSQMNAGVGHARSEILWFLHADCEVPPACAAQITKALRDNHVVGGYFRVRLPRPEWIYRVHDCFGHHLGVLLRVRCGDHGFFCRRTAFHKTGGFPDVPVMEDVEFYRALRTVGRVVEISTRLIISSRRHEQVGPYRYTFACAATVALYCFGLPLYHLARFYNRMISTRDQ